MWNNAGRTRSCAGGMGTKSVAQIQDMFGEFVEFEPEQRKRLRKRMFFPAQVFWMFLSQVLAGNISCHETLQQALAWLFFETEKTASPNTAGYCKARQRLRMDWLEKIQAGAARRLEETVGPEDL